MTVDVKGSTPLWMKIKDLADGVTYNFRIRAKTLTYGPEVEANITTGPGEGQASDLDQTFTHTTLPSDNLLFIPHKVPQALPESPSFLATAPLSPCIGPAAIKAAPPSHDTSSKPGHQVSL